MINLYQIISYLKQPVLVVRQTPVDRVASEDVAPDARVSGDQHHVCHRDGQLEHVVRVLDVSEVDDTIHTVVRFAVKRNNVRLA